MTREDVLKLFPEATDEQITKLLNQNNSEVATEKNKAKQYKAKADTADDLQKQLDEIQAGNLTDLEKANKALETANQQIADLQKNNAIRDQRESAMTNFKITAEQAKTIVKDDGSLDYAELGKIMSEKETAAAQAKEQEIAKSQDVPGGGAGGGNKDEKTEDVKNAESISFGNAAASKEAQNHYVI
jgi:alanyl-tRNA synthetase